MLSLTASPPSPSPPEQAVRTLLNAIQAQSPHAALLASKTHSSKAGRPPSFLSGGAPRDRRGRVAQKPKPHRRASATEDGGLDDGEDDGGETPRNGFTAVGGPRLDFDRERDRDFLEALR